MLVYSMPRLPGAVVNRDKQLLEEVKQKILLHEPMSFVGMAGAGKDHLFTAVVQYLEANRPKDYDLIVCNTISMEELHNFAEHIKSYEGPLIACIDLFLEEDASWFIDTLNDLRQKRKNDFVFYFFSNISDVYLSLISSSKSLSQYLTVLHLLDFEDARKIVEEHTTKINVTLKENQIREIYDISCGHAGLIKSLTLLRVQSPDIAFSKEYLLERPAILYKLTAVLQDIPEEKLSQIVHNQLPQKDDYLFTQMDLLKEGKLFNPLLYDLYLRVNTNTKDLSLLESKVYALFKKNLNEVVSKDDIAKVIWGEDDWEVKYSEWAMSQMIYRIKQKLQKAHIGGEIKADKGKGYVYTTYTT